MREISSGFTGFNKRIFPALFFGLLGLLFTTTVLAGPTGPDLVFLMILVLMAALGYFLMRKMVWDLADKVYDCGESLLIEKRGEEETVPLSDIVNVSVSTFRNPPRITLKLIRPGKFGHEIAFAPMAGFGVNPFLKNRVADDLMGRVHQARSASERSR